MAESFEVVVAGAGMGGLTTAALLAARGFRTLLLERMGQVGGYLADFRRGPYRFDSAASFLGALGEDGEVGQFLAEIGLAGSISFAPVADNMRLILPGRELNTRGRSYIEELAAAFPEQRTELDRFRRILEAVGGDLERFTRLNGWRRLLLPVLFPLLCPRLLRYGRTTVGWLIERTLSDPELRVLAANFPATAAATEVSLIFAAAVLVKGQRGGIFRPEGGVGGFARRIAQRAAAHGASILCGDALAAIEHDGRRVRAVQTASGKRFETQAVVAGFNPAELLSLLRGPDTSRIRAARRRTAAFRYSASSFIVYLGLKPGVDWSKQFFFTTIYETLDTAALYRALGEGRNPEAGLLHVNFPSAGDPRGEETAASTAKLIMPAPYEPFARWRAEEGEAGYRRRKDELADRLVERACRHIPALRDGIVFREAASPLTLERWTGNRRGAMYGLEPTVAQVGPGRWPNRGVLRGLYFCGAYSRPSHGIVGTCYSGRFAADLVTRDLR